MSTLVKELVVAAGIYDCEPSDPDLEVAEEYTDLIKATIEECKKAIEVLGASNSRFIGVAIDQHFGLK